MASDQAVPRPYYVLLLALFPVTTFYSNGLRFLQFSQVADLYLLSLAVLALAALIGFACAGRTTRGALVAGIVLLAFYGQGHADRVLHHFLGDAYGPTPNPYFFATWLLAAGALLVYTARSGRDYFELTRILNAAAAVLLILPTTIIAIKALERDPTVVQALPPIEITKPAVPRDIYYLIFDRYPSNETFERSMAFDNSPFLDALRDRGFYVRDDAVSNYPTTAHSLASSLNFEHLGGLAGRARHGGQAYSPLYEWVRKPRIKSTLRDAGYRIEHFGPKGWGPTEADPHADRSSTVPYRREVRAFISNTVLSVPYNYFHGLPACYAQLRQFERLREIPGETHERPRLVFGHFLLPHPPFVFDRDGRCVAGEPGASDRSRRDKFIAQVEFANAMMLELVDRALAQPGPRPIIVLQGDEGPWPEAYLRDPYGFDWFDATDAEIREKVGILSALYLPDASAADFESAATPVNTFRVVFNRYFGANLEILPNRTYVYRGEYHLWDLHDVTSRAQWPKPSDLSALPPITAEAP